jgi:hypothetical protein
MASGERREGKVASEMRHRGRSREIREMAFGDFGNFGATPVAAPK